MSSEDDKLKHSKRLQNNESVIKKQVKIAKHQGLTERDRHIKQPHRMVKQHAMDCGQPGCVMCGNPRKTFNELTVQEKSFKQTEDWSEN